MTGGTRGRRCRVGSIRGRRCTIQVMNNGKVKLSCEYLRGGSALVRAGSGLCTEDKEDSENSGSGPHRFAVSVGNNVSATCSGCCSTRVFNSTTLGGCRSVKL